MNKFFVVALGAFLSCNSREKKPQPLEEKYKIIGTIERYDSLLDNIVSKDAKAGME